MLRFMTTSFPIRVCRPDNPPACRTPVRRDGHGAAVSDAAWGREHAGLDNRYRSRSGRGRPRSFRTEIGLAPSSGSLIRRRQAPVRKNVPFAGRVGLRPHWAEHSTFCGPAEGLGFGRTRRGLEQRVVFETADARDGASPDSVRPRRRRTRRLRTEKRPANGSLLTHDLLHGKQNGGIRIGPRSPANLAFPSYRDRRCFPAFTAK